MYFGDHNPPHFHILGREGAAQVSIADLAILQRSGKIDVDEALRWAAANRALLAEKWHELSGAT